MGWCPGTRLRRLDHNMSFEPSHREWATPSFPNNHVGDIPIADNDIHDLTSTQGQQCGSIKLPWPGPEPTINSGPHKCCFRSRRESAHTKNTKFHRSFEEQRLNVRRECLIAHSEKSHDSHVLIQNAVCIATQAVKTSSAPKLKMVVHQNLMHVLKNP